MADFTLPELGENIAAGDVLRVLVNPGDTLAKDQPVLELETDKATIEVPSSVAGKIKDIKVKAGDKVKVGQAILSVEDSAAAAASAAPAPAPAKTRLPTPGASKPSREARAREGRAGRRRATLSRVAIKPGREQDRDKVIDFSRGARPSAEAATGEPSAPAAPSVRRMARELAWTSTKSPAPATREESRLRT